MTKLENSFQSEITELKILFGDPVLSTENPEIYNRILTELFRTFQPSDFMAGRWLKEYADGIWDPQGQAVLARQGAIAAS